MANVTDPLARPIHGTNPQNLIEYITRQRIYDSQYWKEHLFGCTAADVAEKAAIQLKAIIIGGSYIMAATRNETNEIPVACVENVTNSTRR